MDKMSTLAKGASPRAAIELSPRTVEARPNTIAEVKVDATFRKIAKNSSCFYIWKIGDDRLDAEQRINYGTFSNNAAYIIYAAGPAGTYVTAETISRETKPGLPLERFIHFWLGSKVNEQKRSNVAHKIQELDSYFNNVAVQYRETEDNESARFMSYFKNGITINCGSLASVKTPNRLYQLRGRKWLRCIEMETISWDYFGAEYIMLLKTDTITFLWLGRSSSSDERVNAFNYLQKHLHLPATSSESLTIVDDGYEQSMPADRKTLWNEWLPLSERMVSQTMPLPEPLVSAKMKIYKCGHKSSRLHLEQLDVVMPTREDFSDSTTAYMLDAYPAAVWLWVGNQAPKEDKTSAMGNGRAFVKKKKYPYSTPVIRVIEGYEPIEFVRLFPQWNSDWHEFNGNLKAVSTNIGKIDRNLLAQRPKMAAELQLIDDGSGERRMYHLVRDAIYDMPVPKIKVFMLCTSHCYVVQYSVAHGAILPDDIENIGVDTIIYQWIGAEAPLDLVAQSEQFSRNLFHNTSKKAMFVNMAEFDETPHFLQLFHGKLIIRHSPKNRSSKKDAPLETVYTDPYASSDSFILKVYGNASYNSKASEVYPMTPMSSKECFVLKTPKHVWVWCGQSSTGDTREVAKRFGSALGETSLVLEGKEPNEFWSSTASITDRAMIVQEANGSCGPHNSTGFDSGHSSTSSHNGGHGPGSLNGTSGINGSVTSSSTSSVAGSVSSTSNSTAFRSSSSAGGSPSKSRQLAQLFIVWSQRDRIFGREIVGYDQTDMSTDSIYLLDAGFIVYIWLGENSPTWEQQSIKQIIQFYADSVPIARRATSAYAVIRQGREPNTFIGFFDHWDRQYWKNYVGYRKKRLEFSPASAISTNGHGNGINGNGSRSIPDAFSEQLQAFDRHLKFPISVLQQETDHLPTEVNPLKRENHLSYDDFVSLFDMSYSEFDALPAWKKQELKKKHKLF